MCAKLFGAAAALVLVMGTAGKSDAQVYFSYGNGFYGNGLSVGVGGVPYYGGVVQSGFYTPYYGGYAYPSYGYGSRSFYSYPSYGGYYSPYRGYSGGYYGGYRRGGYRWR